MDHGHHGGDHMEPMCNMNMLFTWDTTDLCIIFRSWHIRSTTSLVFSLLAVAALTAGYELVREASRRYETGGSLYNSPNNNTNSSSNSNSNTFNSSLSPGGAEDADAESSSPLLWPGGKASSSSSRSPRRSKTVKGLLYAVQVFYSFFIMLLFMTYNGWVMLAVAVGAFVGYMVFGNSSSGGSATKSVACH